MSWRRYALQLFLIKILHRLQLTRPLCRHGVKVESSSRWLTGIGMAPWTNERQDSLTSRVHFFSQREPYTDAKLLKMAGALLYLNPVLTHQDVPHWFVDDCFKKPNILHHGSGHIEYSESSYSSKKPSCFVEIWYQILFHNMQQQQVWLSTKSLVSAAFYSADLVPCLVTRSAQSSVFTFTRTPENLLLLLQAVQSCCAGGENSNTSLQLCSG